MVFIQMLFIYAISIKPLGEAIKRFELSCRYANDIHLYLQILSNSKEAVECLNHYLEAVMGWIRGNKLRSNAEQMVGP